MKATIKQIVIIGIVAITTFSLAACDNGSTKRKTLVSIEVTTQPTKIAYIIGEEFDSTGMEVTAYYDDGSWAPVTDYTTDGFDSDTAGTKTVTVSYDGKETTLEVTVFKTLVSIAVATEPTKILYKIGEEFDPSGMVVTVTYDNGSTAAVADYTVNGFDSTEVGSKIVTVTFEGKTTAFTVTVEKTLASITVTTEPTKIEYKIGEEFDPSGMVVTVAYDNGSTAVVADYDYTVNGFDSVVTGIKTITVSFEGKNGTFIVTVGKTLASIAVTTEPTKIEYKIGEPFDPSGMVVTAAYDDGSTAVVADYNYTVNGFDSVVTGIKTITVSFEGKNATFIVTVGKTLASIAITTEPTKVEYKIGETFNPAGMVVTAYYDDNSSAPVTGYTTDGFDSDTAGIITITIRYNSKETTLEVTVDKTLQRIEVTTRPTKTAYIIGEEFDPTGMVVTAYYDDNSSVPVTDYTIGSFASGTAGTKIVTVNYNHKETTLEVTVQQQEAFTITFNQIADAAPQIQGLTIYLLDGREGKPTEAVLDLASPGQYDSNSIKWYVTGTNITGSGATFTLKSSDYIRIGDYFLTVEVKKNGIPYNQTITFTVAP